MPDFRRGSGPQEPSLEEVRRTDGFIDALAGGRPVVPQDPADAELAALLGDWRDELRWPPATGLLSEADVTAAFNAGRAQKRSGLDPQRWTDTQKRTSAMRHRRGLSVIGASAAAVLCIGGFGAVVVGSGPGDALYGLHTMLVGPQKQVRDDQVGLAAKTELNQVQTLIAQGDWEQAQDKLVAVSTQVATIDDQQQKQELLDQFNDLSAKVVERDPAATAPPGVVYTVPPSSAALVPAVEPTSTPSAPPSPTKTETSSSAGSASSATSSAPSDTTATTAAPSETTTAAPSEATSTTAPSEATSTTAPSEAAATAEAPSEAAATTAVPSDPTTTTAAPSEAAATTAAPSAATATAQSPSSATPNEPTAESASSAATTTTVLVPVPAGA